MAVESRQALVRYARAAVGPIGGAGAQFVLALVLLARLPAAGFGCFAFLMVVAQLGLGVWGALFAAPLLVAAVQREGLGGLAVAALAAMVPAGVVIGAVALTGGWLDSAPGMPDALTPDLLTASLLCMLRTLAASGA